MAKEMDIVQRVQKTIDHVKAFGEGKDEGYGTATAVIRDATEALADARTAGVDVSGLRAITGTGAEGKTCLRRDSRRSRSETRGRENAGVHYAAHRHPGCPERYCRRKKRGSNVIDLESGMPEMERSAWRFAAKKASRVV